MVPGALHILHNLTQDMHERMVWWPTFWNHLKSFEQLLCAQHNRERLVATCVMDSPSRGSARDFQYFSGKLYDKRWNACAHFIKKLKPLLETLLAVWDEQKFLNGGGHGHAAEDGLLPGN
eukprot:8486579-Lingulodinium_polyedra.AAC.1